MDIIDADAAKLAGLQIDQLQKMRAGHLTLTHLEWFVGLSKTQRDMLTGADLMALKPSSAGEPPFTITVDYGKSFEDMVAAGDYDWRDNGLNGKNFPITESGVKRFAAKLFPGGCSSEDGVRRIEAEGWKPAEIEHVLAFGAQFKNEQRKAPIAGLGSPARVDAIRSRLVPSLVRNGAERGLRRDWWGFGWPVSWRLLAVREISGD